MTKRHSGRSMSPADLSADTLDGQADSINHAPVIDDTQTLSSTTHEHDAPLIIDVLAYAHDEDGDPLTITAVTASGDFAAVITDDQKIEVTYTGPDVDPNLGDIAAPEVRGGLTFTVSDGTDTATAGWSIGLWAQWEPGEFLVGTKNADTMTGSRIDQRIYGRAGNDILLGRGGDDLLEGDRGDDIYKGGAGSDTFMLYRFSGHDIIWDFSRADGDVISFGGGPGTLNADIQSLRYVRNHSVDIGDDMLFVEDRHHTVEIKGMNVDDLKWSDFAF